jgi:DNA-directed RNA polymerase specialized sigma24 family protein
MSVPLDEMSLEILSYHPLILSKVRQVHIRLSASNRRRVRREWLYSAGMLGVWKALKNIQDGLEVRNVSCYVATCIRTSMYDWLRTDGYLMNNGATRLRFFEGLFTDAPSNGFSSEDLTEQERIEHMLAKDCRVNRRVYGAGLLVGLYQS